MGIYKILTSNGSAARKQGYVSVERAADYRAIAGPYRY